MFIFGDEDDFSFDSSPDRCGGTGTTESFLSNTFRDGGLPTTPTSPPTPVKVIKIETTLSDQSPLVASTPFQSFVSDGGCVTSDEERDSLVEAARLPPPHCERMEAILTCTTTVAAPTSNSGGRNGVGKEKTVGEILTTVTTVEERPVDFSLTSSTALTGNNSPCTCRRAVLGKRKHEEVEKEDLVSFNDCPCRCSVEQAGEDRRTDSMCVLEGRKEDEEEEEDDCASSPSKKLCNRPSVLSLNGTKRINGLNGLNNVYSVLGLDPLAPPTSSSSSSSPSSSRSARSPPPSSEEADEDSSTPSPIDFTKVDPTLYDYDTRAPLFIPTQDTPPGPSPVTDNKDTSAVEGGESGDNSCGSVPSTTSPDSSSAPPSSSSLPPCSSSTTLPPPPPPAAAGDDAFCPSESVTSPTLAITATSTTFSLPSSSSSSEYPHISSSSAHNCSMTDSCSSASTATVVESNLADSNGISDPSDSHSNINEHSSLVLSSSPSSSASCSLEGLVSAQNGNLVHNENKRTGNESSISNGLNRGIPSSPEGAENDFLEDIEHIVSLLMT